MYKIQDTQGYEIATLENLRDTIDSDFHSLIVYGGYTLAVDRNLLLYDLSKDLHDFLESVPRFEVVENLADLISAFGNYRDYSACLYGDKYLGLFSQDLEAEAKRLILC